MRTAQKSHTVRVGMTYIIRPLFKIVRHVSLSSLLPLLRVSGKKSVLGFTQLDQRQAASAVYEVLRAVVVVFFSNLALVVALKVFQLVWLQLR